MALVLGHLLHNMLSWFTLASCFFFPKIALGYNSKPSCQKESGTNLKVPCLLIGSGKGSCSMSQCVDMNCNTSFRPAKSFSFPRTRNLDHMAGLEVVHLGSSQVPMPSGIKRLPRSNGRHSHVPLPNKSFILPRNSRRFDPTYKQLKYHRMKNSRGYIPIPYIQVFPVRLILGLGYLCSVLLFWITGVYFSVKKHILIRRSRSHFFQKNGGLLLQQHSNASQNGITKVFTANELEFATEYYKESHIIGTGGDGGIERFINEIVTLANIDHQNVIKFFGCCLETETPMLVYELTSNGTLFDYIHHTNGKISLPWDTFLQVASDSAAALAYLHSTSIIHGNVKSSNILLTDRFVAKVAGFGPSRFVPCNESQISTLVQKTLGYLDPEYFHKGRLTDKSDVYSFGMVLLEIVTGEKPISFSRPESQRIMSSHFVLSMELQSGLFDQIVGTEVEQGHREQVRAVAELAKRCLSLSSAERPAMEEVARELRMLR